MEWGRVLSFSSLQRGTCEGRTWHVLMRERDSPSADPRGSPLSCISSGFFAGGEGKPCAAKGVDLTVIPPELVSILKAWYFRLLCREKKHTRVTTIKDVGLEVCVVFLVALRNPDIPAHFIWLVRPGYKPS